MEFPSKEIPGFPPRSMVLGKVCGYRVFLYEGIKFCALLKQRDSGFNSIGKQKARGLYPLSPPEKGWKMRSHRKSRDGKGADRHSLISTSRYCKSEDNQLIINSPKALLPQTSLASGRGSWYHAHCNQLRLLGSVRCLLFAD